MSTKTVLFAPVTQPVGPVQVTAAQVRKYRNERGWSARELADRCKQAGLDWNLSIVQNLELGRRAIVSIDEMLVLAYVLGVPFLELFIPLGDAGEFLVTPNLAVDPYVAHLWADGHLPRVDQGLSTAPHSAAEDAQIWSRARLPLMLFARLHAAAVAFESSSEQLAEAEQTGDVERIDTARRNRLADIRRGVNAFDQIISNGLTPPRLPAVFVEALRTEGGVKPPDAVRVHQESPVRDIE